jgi:hypothetical protein
MVTRTWNGGAGNWFLPGNWTPAGSLAPGDTAIVRSGTPTINAGSFISDETITLGGSTSSVTLRVVESTFDTDTTINVVGSNTAALDVVLRSEGETTFENLIYLLAPHGTLTIDAQPDGTTAGNFQLTNSADSTLILVSRESTLNLSGETITNDGTFEVDGVVHVDIGTTLAGAGFVVLQAGGKFFVEGSVGTDQAVKFDDGTGLLRVAHTNQFDAEIEFSADSGRFDLTDIAAKSVQFTSGSSSGDFGTLTLYADPNQTGTVLKELKVRGEQPLATEDFQLAGDGGSGTLITYDAGAVTKLAQPMPVPLVAAAGTMVSLSDIFAQSFGTADPGFYAITLLPTAAKADPTGRNVGFWEQSAEAVRPVWYVNGQAVDAAYKVQPGNDVELKVGNSINPISVTARVTPAATGANAEYITYDIFMVDPAVAPQPGSTPTPAGEVASADRYNAIFGAIPNVNYCQIIADNVAAGNGAPIATQWDEWLSPRSGLAGGFWRIPYRGSDVPVPVENWSTLVQPGDVVSMAWTDQSGSAPAELRNGHITTVLAGGGPGNPDTTPVTFYDNADYPPATPR